MDQALISLIAGVIPFLSPYLPTIADKAAGKLGEELPGNIAKLWKSLQTRFSKNSASQEAVQDLLQNPTDPDVQAAFRVQLRKLLESDPQFRAELIELLGDSSQRTEGVKSQDGIANIYVQGTANTVDQRIGQVVQSVTNLGYQPRQIPTELVTEFVAQMRRVQPVEVDITANMLDGQTQFLANQLTDLLQRAGWKATGPSLSVYGPDMPKGIVYILPKSIGSPDSTSIDALAAFLARLGFLNYKLIDAPQSITTIFINRV